MGGERRARRPQSHFVRFTRASRTRCRECRAPRSLSFAAPGFSVAQLAEQARTVVAHAPHRYVIVDLGVRDLCTGTPLERFEQQLDRGLRLLTEGRSGDLPNFVLVASIEDVSAKWRVLRADRDAARAFAAGATMECGLGAAATPARVAALRVRAKALNEIIAEVCFLHVLCLYDRGTRFALPLRAGYFSPRDYRLLSTAGQRAVAAAEWPVALRLLAAA